jgi:hypothetical protein
VEGWRSREVAADMESAALAFDSNGEEYLAMTRDGRVFMDGMGQGHALLRVGDLLGSVRNFAIDANGDRHVTLVDDSDNVIYAQGRAGGWQSTVIGQGLPIALGLDASGFAHVAFNMKTSSVYRFAYATNRSGQWVVTELGLDAATVRAELAVDASGHVHIAWADDPDSGIFYATNASGSWVVEQVADIVSKKPALAIDSSGRPHLLFPVEGAYVQHAVKEEGGWRFEDVGPSPGVALELVADARGNLHAVLFRAQNPRVVQAFLPAGSHSWSYTPIFDLDLDGRGRVAAPLDFALGVGPSGEVRIGYWYSIFDDNIELVGSSVRYAEPCP